jgi:hypothetical protein
LPTAGLSVWMTWLEIQAAGSHSQAVNFLQAGGRFPLAPRALLVCSQASPAGVAEGGGPNINLRITKREASR